MKTNKFPNRNLIWLSGFSGISAVCLDIFIIIFMGFMTPGYKPLSQYISELGSRINPYAGIVNVWWSFYSLLMVFFAYGLYLAVKKNRYGWIAPFFIVLDSVGNGVLSGLFSCDIGCRGTGISNTLHLVVSAAGSIAATASPLALYFAVHNDMKWKRFSKQLFITGLLIVASFALMGYFEFMVIASSRPFVFSGLVQRIQSSIYYWFIVRVSVQMMRGES